MDLIEAYILLGKARRKMVIIQSNHLLYQYLRKIATEPNVMTLQVILRLKDLIQKKVQITKVKPKTMGIN